MDAEQLARWQTMLGQAQSFMPESPIGARDRVRIALAEMTESADDTLQARELRAEAQALLAFYERATDAWQAENARRAAAHEARERATTERQSES